MIKQYSEKSDICPWRSWYWCVLQMFLVHWYAVSMVFWSLY